MIFNKTKGRRQTKVTPMGRRPPLKNPWSRFYLEDWLKLRNMSAAELARKSGVSEAMVSLILRRKTNGSPGTLQKIAHALDIRVGELFDVKPRPGRRTLLVSVAEDDIMTIRRVLKGLDADLLNN